MLGERVCLRGFAAAARTSIEAIQADASLAAPQIGPHDHAETLIGGAARWIRKYKAQIGLQQGKAGRVRPLHRGGPGRDPCLVSGWRTAQRLFDHLVDRRVRSERGARRRDHAKGNGCVRHIGKTGAEQDEHRGGVKD